MAWLCLRWHATVAADEAQCMNVVAPVEAFTLQAGCVRAQSGLFVVEVFPGHCDCLALSNALAKRMGVTNSGAQGSCSSDDKSETCSLGITGQ